MREFRNRHAGVTSGILGDTSGTCPGQGRQPNLSLWLGVPRGAYTSMTFHCLFDMSADSLHN